MKNVIYMIGHMSNMTAYLNVTQEEAETRYRAANDGDLETVRKIEFEDEIECYNIYGGVEVDPVTHYS